MSIRETFKNLDSRTEYETRKVVSAHASLSISYTIYSLHKHLGFHFEVPNLCFTVINPTTLLFTLIPHLYFHQCFTSRRCSVTEPALYSICISLQSRHKIHGLNFWSEAPVCSQLELTESTKQEGLNCRF